MLNNLFNSCFFACVLGTGSFAPPPLDHLTLVLNMANKKEVPKNFRTMNSSFEGYHVVFPTREGLNLLNASGSGQFSELALDAVQHMIPLEKKIFVIDLRQESHGFINGMAASWRDTRDWSNIGKTLQEVDQNENARLQQLLKQGIAFVSTKHVLIPVLVEKVATEQQIVNGRHLSYKRIPVTDHRRPTDADVDSFLQFVRGLPEKSWIHFHCAAGKGRTTAFLIMYDMLHNAKQVSFEQILKRQHLLGGANYLSFSRTSWKYPLNLEKQQFLRKFYDYCRKADPSTILWTDWLKANSYVNLSH